MKRLICLFPGVLLFLSAVCVMPAEGFTKENTPDQNRLIETVFDLLYPEKGRASPARTAELEALLDQLDAYEKTHPDEKREILFARAESYDTLGNYQKAYVTFYQLKVRMTDKNDPLFSIVESRLKDLKEKVGPVKGKEPGNQGRENNGVGNQETIADAEKSVDLFWSALVVIGLLAAGAFFLIWHDIQSRTTSGAWQRTYDSRILGRGDLIRLEEMRRQDGRCSKSAVDAYKELKKKWLNSKDGWEGLSIHEKEKLKNARLIVEGHEMITRVNTLAPYPIALVSHLPFFKNVPYFWQYTFVGFAFIALWFLFKLLGWCRFSCNETFFFVAAFLISCLYGIRIMAAKTINALDEIVSMLEPEGAKGNIENVNAWVQLLFRSLRQYYFFIVIMGIVFVCMYLRGELMIEPASSVGLSYLNLNILFSAFLVWVTSSLVWFMTGALLFMSRLSKMKDLSMNPLSPSKTLGLEKMISVIGTYNIVCSMVLTLGCSIPVYEAYANRQNLVYGWLWFFLITPMLIFFWIYPYIKIGRLVKAKKLKRMNFIKTKISLLFADWEASEGTLLEKNENRNAFDEQTNKQLLSEMKAEKAIISEKLEEMGRYYDVFRKIEQSPESHFDLNSVLQLAKVMGIPSVFALASALFSIFRG